MLDPLKVMDKLLHLITFLRKKHNSYIDLFEFRRLHCQPIYCMTDGCQL